MHSKDDILKQVGEIKRIANGTIAEIKSGIAKLEKELENANKEDARIIKYKLGLLRKEGFKKLKRERELKEQLEKVKSGNFVLSNEQAEKVVDFINTHCDEKVTLGKSYAGGFIEIVSNSGREKVIDKKTDFSEVKNVSQFNEPEDVVKTDKEFTVIGDNLFVETSKLKDGVCYVVQNKSLTDRSKTTNKSFVKLKEYFGNGSLAEAISLRNELKKYSEKAKMTMNLLPVLDYLIEDLKIPLRDLRGIDSFRININSGEKDFVRDVKKELLTITNRGKVSISNEKMKELYQKTLFRSLRNYSAYDNINDIVIMFPPEKMKDIQVGFENENFKN